MTVYAHVEVLGYATQTVPLQYESVDEVLTQVMDTFRDSSFVHLGATVFRAEQIAFIRFTTTEDGS